MGSRKSGTLLMERDRVPQSMTGNGLISWAIRAATPEQIPKGTQGGQGQARQFRLYFP